MVHARNTHRIQIASWRPLGILLLSPLIVVLTVAILFGLLGIFVLWLTIVGGIVTAIVVSDLVRRSTSRLARPPLGRLDHGSVGYPGR
jgi:hypothetical protein